VFCFVFVFVGVSEVTSKMGERQNTIVCAFDMKSPRISAYEIHEWIYEQLKLEDDEVLMVQIGGPQRHVHIKLRDINRLQQVLHLTGGQAEYRHNNGEISKVRVETAGLGTRRVRIANLPPEVPEEIIRTMMARYGEVKDVQAEKWSRIYRYKVPNGVRIAVLTLAKHIPSIITIAGHRAQVSYEGHPMTYYRCHETGHLHQACPMRRRVGQMGHTGTATSWADIAAKETQRPRQDREAVDEEEQKIVHTESVDRDPERESEKHADDGRARHLGEKGLQHIAEQEVTGRSDIMKVITPQTTAPMQTEETQMGCEGERQEKETDETRQRTPSTQQHHNEGNQSEMEEKGSAEESVDAELWSTVDTSAPKEVGGSTAAQPTKPKRPKN
jgi:hypothetical protein